MPRIEAVVFDMDGVLIDAKEWHYSALNRALGIFGTQIDRPRHLQDFDGLPTRVKLELLTAEFGFPRGLHSFVSELKQIYTQEIALRECKPNHQHLIMMHRLRERDIRTACASNSIRASVDLLLGLAGLDSYLEFTLSNEDVVVAKPSPEIYLLACEKLALDPQSVLVVEDNQHGIEAALQAGCRVLSVAGVEEVSFTSVSQAGEIR
jgi:beta-phosphoglucomutase